MNLPIDIFKDADEGIDQEEEVNIDIAEVRDEKGMVIDNNFVSFERNEMKIRGDTKGEALSTVNGEKNWTVRLKAEDKAGLREYLDVKLVLRRNAPESDIQIQEDNILKKEGEAI